jgi:hypothetical protein
MGGQLDIVVSAPEPTRTVDGRGPREHQIVAGHGGSLQRSGDYQPLQGWNGEKNER